MSSPLQSPVKQAVLSASSSSSGPSYPLVYRIRTLGNYPRLATYPGGLTCVVVRLAFDILADDGSHVLGHTPSGDKSRAFDQGKRAGQRGIFKKLSERRRGGLER